MSANGGSANSITLWGAGTMRTHRVLWFAEEMGVTYDHRPIQPRTGETKTPEKDA